MAQSFSLASMYFNDDPPWRRQIQEVLNQTSAWRSVQQSTMSHLRADLVRQAGFSRLSKQITELQNQQWQFSSAASAMVAQYQKDIARQAGLGKIAAQAFEMRNSALKNALEAAAPRGFMQSIGQSYAESVRGLFPTVSIQTEFAGSVAATIAEALREGWVDTELVEDAAEYVDEESPEFSLAVQHSADGLVAWDEVTRNQMVMAWKVTLYITQFVLLMWLFGAFEAKSPQEALRIVLGGLLEGWLSGRVVDSLTGPKDGGD